MRGRRLLFRITSGRRLRVLLLAVVTVVALGAGIATYATGLLNSLEGSTINGRFSVRGKEQPPKNLVLVAVDDKTLHDMNLWPFPRAFYARLINNIAAQHPAAIAFDIELSEQSARGEQDDITLLNAIQDHPGLTAFSTTAPSTSGNGQIRFLGSDQGTTLLHQAYSQPGAAVFPLSPGGVYRQMVYSDQGVKTLYVAAADIATHRHITKKQFGGTRWIDFRGPAGTIQAVPFSSVYNPKKFGAVPSNIFRGKIVVVGATQLSLQDFHATSTDGHMPGPEIQANAIDTILRGFPLTSAPGWVNILLIIVLGAAVPAAALRLNAAATVALAIGLGLVFTVGTQLAFNSGAVTSFIYPLGALVISSVGSLAVLLLTEAFERIRVRDLFSRFVPEEVVDEVLESADGLRLGGVQREGTVMFCDLRGFTTFAESLTPPRVIEVLNRYLSEMSDAILDHGGTLVAYMGDGIMAVFGAPLAQPDHADRALGAAKEMLQVRLPRFNGWLKSEGLSEGFRMGIGLNSGHVMSGHVGSERRVEYAAVGDTTNTASRIEGLTKGTPHQLLLSGETKEALVSPPGDLMEVGETDIRGRTGRMQLWSIQEAPEARERPPAEEAAPLPASGPGV